MKIDRGHESSACPAVLRDNVETTLTLCRIPGPSLSLLLLLAGCHSSATGQGPAIVQPGAPGEPSKVIGADRAADLSKVPVTPADVRFMQGMIGHHSQARSLLSGLLVVPRVHLKPPFDENWSAFFQVLTGDLGCSSPQRDVDKCDFFALFAAISRVRSIYRDAEITDSAAFGRVTHFRITSNISE